MNIIYLLVSFIRLAIWIYSLLLFVAILSSWFPEWQRHKIFIALRKVTDPYLGLFRRFIPSIGMIDISPIIAFFALQMVDYVVTWVLL